MKKYCLLFCASLALSLPLIASYSLPSPLLTLYCQELSGGTNRMIKSNPPCGGCTGTSWDECGKHRVSRIIVAMDANHNLNSLQFGYVDEGNSITLSKRYGSEGPNLRVVVLNYPSEYLTGINGTFRNSRINSITFTTNQGKYGPFGVQIPDAQTFNIEMGSGFYGFHGISGSFLFALGVYIKQNASLVQKDDGSTGQSILICLGLCAVLYYWNCTRPRLSRPPQKLMSRPPPQKLMWWSPWHG